MLQNKAVCFMVSLRGLSVYGSRNTRTAVAIVKPRMIPFPHPGRLERRCFGVSSFLSSVLQSSAVSTVGRQGGNKCFMVGFTTLLWTLNSVDNRQGRKWICAAQRKAWSLLLELWYNPQKQLQSSALFWIFKSCQWRKTKDLRANWLT